MAKILFIDDMEERQVEFLYLAEGAGHKITQARNYTEANHQLHNKEFDIVFLDHDLSLADIMCVPGQPTRCATGSDLAEAIVKDKLQIPVIVIHSFNPTGSANMASILRKAGISSIENHSDLN